MTGASPDGFVARLWSLCNILRGDGVGYNQYISELTYLLFLKLAKETGAESLLPSDYRWDDLVRYGGSNMLGYYQEFLTHLGAAAGSDLVRCIYAFPTTVFSHSENLAAVLQGIDALSWNRLDADAIGDVYEGLLSKNSEDTRSGAGQYFTPRALVDCMVECVSPAPGETIQDPSAGTGGFLISADQFVRSHHAEAYATRPPKYEGMEIERGTHRLCLMNAFLHRMDAHIHLGDTLTSDAETLTTADVILANPPFGSRAGGQRLGREDLAHTSSNRQLQFLQHVYRSLRPGGRAAIVVPDNVLFEAGSARRVREELMSRCDLHTVLRLPIGIFYAQNVSTHVLLMERGRDASLRTGGTWVYDLRSGMPRFGKRRQLKKADFVGFKTAFTRLRNGEADLAENDAAGRLRRFTPEQVTSQSEDLMTGWAAASNEAESHADDPEAAIQSMLASLDWMTAELKAVLEELAESPYDREAVVD